jgi:flagellin-specific chaperone FliS
VEPLQRDRGQARADARRHQQLPHQRPAGAAPRRPGRVPRHRPRPARLRDHRPGHDLADHREQARGAAPVPREAAGVSKYKERRRETETRLKDTRENLTRVEDILRELNANLDKLESQAEVAGQYRALQQQAELKLNQLRFLKHRDAAREEERAKAAVLDAVNRLEARVAELRAAEAELEALRQSTTRPATSCTPRRARCRKPP